MVKLTKSGWKDFPSAPTVRGHYAQGSFCHSGNRSRRTGNRFICAASAAP
jgi:hypothetical protein